MYPQVSPLGLSERECPPATPELLELSGSHSPQGFRPHVRGSGSSDEFKMAPVRLLGLPLGELLLPVQSQPAQPS